MTYIPHSTHEDEPRLIMPITDLIKKKDLGGVHLANKFQRREGQVSSKESVREGGERGQGFGKGTRRLG